MMETLEERHAAMRDGGEYYIREKDGYTVAVFNSEGFIGRHLDEDGLVALFKKRGWDTSDSARDMFREAMTYAPGTDHNGWPPEEFESATPGGKVQ